MKNRKIGLVSGILAGLLLAGLVIGAEIYTRTPPGYTISNPVGFQFQGALDNPEIHSWKLKVIDMGSVEYISECFITNDETFAGDFPLGEYKQVIIYTWTDAACSVAENDWTLEFDEGNPIFEIIPTPPVFFDDVGGMMAGSVAMVGELFTDLAPALITGLGVSLGLTYVIPKVIDVFKG